MEEEIAQEIQFLETEYGTFTNNTSTGQTAEEVYQEWLDNKDIPVAPQPTEIYILEQENEKLKSRLMSLEQATTETVTTQQDLIEILIELGVM